MRSYGFPAVFAVIILATQAIATERPNVLFISVDDLRPELGCYGNREIKTPHLDKFSNSAAISAARPWCRSRNCIPGAKNTPVRAAT